MKFISVCFNFYVNIDEQMRTELIDASLVNDLIILCWAMLDASGKCQISVKVIRAVLLQIFLN